MSNPTTCTECGSTPMGEACYHICPNSIHYYSPEQEAQDDASYYSDADYYREAGYDDPDYDDVDQDAEYEAVVAYDHQPSVVADDDLPF